MSIIIFTLLAVALGCGMGSKAKKDKKQREKRLQQGSIPAEEPLFIPEKMPFEPAEIPFEPTETISDTFWDVPEQSLETMEFEDAEPLMETQEMPEPEVKKTSEPQSQEKEAAKDFSLRQAVIAQTVLERKYH